MNPRDCIFFNLSRAGRSGARFLKTELADLGVTASQAMALVFLLEEEPVSASAFGDTVDIDYATLTGLVDRLTSMDLVNRSASSDDRRSVLLTLTAKGRALAKKIYGRLDAANRKFLDGLTRDEAGALRRLIGKLNDRDDADRRSDD